MKVYQFIKYNQDTKIDHLRNYGNDNLIVCFDFEDGIQDSLNEDKTSSLKEKHREYFVSLTTNIEDRIKIGIRLNAKDKVEFQKDIVKIKGIHIHSIFIPKIEGAKDLSAVIRKLEDNKIIYKEIIPVIENRIGLNNIDEIIKVNHIRNIAFGHCDYNMSLNNLPFFHQENFEYWKWIYKIVSKTNRNNICFINSPYLSLQNPDFFCAMIDHLNKITNNNFGLVSLTSTHTELCLHPPMHNNQDFNKLLNNRCQSYPTNDYLEELIYNFEKFNTGQGLSKCLNRIISIQEYLSAKKYLSRKSQEKVSLAFVGGCFPVQHNILYEDIFLTKAKKKIESFFNIELQTDIIRYERLSTVMDKIKKLNGHKSINILIFSIRPEPYLRLVKFYYQYIDNEGTIKHSLNMPVFKIVNPEKYDILILSRKYNYGRKQKEAVFYKFLIDFNYRIGELFGNKSYALKKNVELVARIIQYCSNNNIKLILLGPNLRANTKYEPHLSKELDYKMRNSFPGIHYINGLDVNYKGKEVLQKNGIHVNEQYHEMMADRIGTYLKQLVSSC